MVSTEPDRVHRSWGKRVTSFRAASATSQSQVGILEYAFLPTYGWAYGTQRSGGGPLVTLILGWCWPHKAWSSWLDQHSPPVQGGIQEHPTTPGFLGSYWESKLILLLRQVLTESPLQAWSNILISVFPFLEPKCLFQLFVNTVDNLKAPKTDASLWYS
jgi:hypothetical protein